MFRNLLERLSTSTTRLTTAEARPHAAGPLALAININVSALDVLSSQGLQIPEPEAPPHDVLLDPHLRNHDILLQVLILKSKSPRHPVFQSAFFPHRTTFSLIIVDRRDPCDPCFGDSGLLRPRSIPRLRGGPLNSSAIQRHPLTPPSHHPHL